MPVCSLLTSKKGVKLRLCRTAPHIWFHTIRHFHPVSFDSDSPLLSCFIPPFLFKFEVYLHWALTVLLWESPLCFYCILPFLSHIGYVIISLEAPSLEEAPTWTLPPPNPPPLPKKKKTSPKTWFQHILQKPSFVTSLQLVISGALARKACTAEHHKCSKILIRKKLVITWSYTTCLTVRTTGISM